MSQWIGCAFLPSSTVDLSSTPNLNIYTFYEIESNDTFSCLLNWQYSSEIEQSN